MLENYDFIVNRHSRFKLKFILVVKTDVLIKSIEKDIQNELILVAKNIFTLKNRLHIEEINFKEGNGMEIHFEILTINDLDCRKLINNFKTVSSRSIRSKFNNRLSQIGLKKGFWEQKYFLMTKNYN